MGSPITAWAAKPYLRRARSTPSLRAGRVSPELMTSARVLVTGGAGFLGSHLCDALLAEGYSVIAVDNLLTGKASNLDHLARESRFELQQLDICEPFDCGDRKSTRLNSSHRCISYAVFCLKKKKKETK